MNPVERRLIGYTAAAHGLVHIMELTYPALLSRIEHDFGIRAFVAGALATVFGWAFGSSAIPAGFLTDRLGSRRVVVYAFSLAAVMAVLVGLAPNAWLLGAGLLGLGLSIGLYHPAGLSLMAQGVRQRGLALGFHGVAGNIGQALAPAIAVGLAVAVDWRLAFFFVAALAAVLAVVMAAVRLPLQGEAEVVSSEAAPEHRPAPNLRNHRLLAPLLITYAAFVLSGTVYRGAITFLPQHLEDFVDKDLGGAFATVALLFGALGQLVGGTLSQRVKLERLAPVIGVLTLPPLILTGLLTGAPLVVVASVFVFFYFANQPVLTGLIADYSPAGAVGRSYGISFFAGFGLGSTGGIIAGAFVDRWDTSAAFLGLSAFLAVTFVLIMVLWVMAERRVRAAPLAQVGAEGSL
ncbi:MAG TPA: MFS transporter [Dehalococcoidia bacterium]|nr:MFS transporter [Dehalococcoidia bacterium]